MRLLLDTHAALVSAASAWEITTKHRLGKLPGAALAAADLDGPIAAQGFEALAITPPHAAQAGRLAGPHRDPFDRLPIARALSEQLVLVSNETPFDRYWARRLW